MSTTDQWVWSTKWHLDQVMTTGRYSTGLIRELETHLENGTANIFQIIAEIAALEGARTRRLGTKLATKFRGRWLNGLWHKHYTQARFMPRNLGQHWTPDRIDPLVDEFCSRSSIVDEQWTWEFSRRLVEGGYLERANDGRLTGEWIVFANQDERNYYLTLGIHNDDEAIWHRCKACAVDFPGLRVLQEDR